MQHRLLLWACYYSLGPTYELENVEHVIRLHHPGPIKPGRATRVLAHASCHDSIPAFTCRRFAWGGDICTVSCGSKSSDHCPLLLTLLCSQTIWKMNELSKLHKLLSKMEWNLLLRNHRGHDSTLRTTVLCFFLFFHTHVPSPFQVSMGF